MNEYDKKHRFQHHLKHLIPEEGSMESPSTQSYSVQCMPLCSLFQHAQQLLPSYSCHTFQVPKSKKLLLEKSDINKIFLLQYQI